MALSLINFWNRGSTLDLVIHFKYYIILSFNTIVLSKILSSFNPMLDFF